MSSIAPPQFWQFMEKCSHTRGHSTGTGQRSRYRPPPARRRDLNGEREGGSRILGSMGRLLLIGHDPALVAALRTSHHLRDHDVDSCTGPFEATQLPLASWCVRRRPITDPATTPAGDPALTISRELRQRAARHAHHRARAGALEQRGDRQRCGSRSTPGSTRPVDYEELLDMARARDQDPDWQERHRDRVGTTPLDHAARLVPARDRRSPDAVHDRVPLRAAHGERDLLMTAFRELLLNAMEHGAGFDPEKVIEVTAARTARTLVFHFRDPGNGFDRADLSHAPRRRSPAMSWRPSRNARRPACGPVASAC